MMLKKPIDRSIPGPNPVFLLCVYDDYGRAATVGGRRRRRRNGRRETRGAREEGTELNVSKKKESQAKKK